MKQYRFKIMKGNSMKREFVNMPARDIVEAWLLIMAKVFPIISEVKKIELHEIK